LGSLQLDARVRSSAAVAGYSSVRANALAALETSLREPGADGISGQLNEFWAAWQDLANSPGEAAPSAVLLQQAGVLTSEIARGYREAETQWTIVRTDATGMVEEVNDAARQVAELNLRIRTTGASGGNVNELLDLRSTLTTTIAALTGATVRANGDGTVDVVIAGDSLVRGVNARELTLAGATNMLGPGIDVHVEWADRPGAILPLDGGELDGAVSLLGAANATGTGGVIAETAESYNAFANDLAKKVNDIHFSGAIADGTTGHDIFHVSGALPPALELSVIPTSAAEIAAGDPTDGPYSGAVADAIAQLGAGRALDASNNPVASPDSVWSAFVTRIAGATKAEMQYASLADLAATSATSEQLANASVALDEENVNLLAYQHAYQGAARVMTAVDEMLDTLINRTGLVGR
jgi:flagellar hook-associated protein 1 FlgK